MNHNRIYWSGVIFVSTMLTLAKFVPTTATTAELTETNKLDCVDVQCPFACPIDSYLKTNADDEEIEDEDEDDSEDLGLFDVEELGQFDQHQDYQSMTHYLHKRDIPSHTEVRRCCEHQHCVCKECEEVPECSEDQVAIEIHKGDGEPGNCCSLFKCVAKQQCVMGVKQTYWKTKCLKCSCFGEREMCEDHCPPEDVIQNCFSDYHQEMMSNGETWMEGSCVSCSCDEGDKRCVTPICKSLDCKNIITAEDECCPRCAEAGDEEVEEDINEVVSMPEEVEKEPEMEKNTSTKVNATPSSISSTVKETMVDEVSNSEAVADQTTSSAATTTPTSYDVDGNTTLDKSSTVEYVEKNYTAVTLSTNSDQSTESSSTLAASTFNITTISSSSMETTEKTPTSENVEISTSTMTETSEAYNSSTQSSSTQDENDTTTDKSESEGQLSNATSSTETYSTQTSTDSSSTPLANSSLYNSVSTSNIESSTATENTVAEMESEKEISSSTAKSTTPDNSNSTQTLTKSTSTNEQENSSAVSTHKNAQEPDEETSTTSVNSTTETTLNTSTEKISTSVPYTPSPASSTQPSTSSPLTETALNTGTDRSSSTTHEVHVSSSSTTSSTSAPELLEPLRQREASPFEDADFINQSTQHQRRSVFDETDYAMIAFVIGTLLVIALCLIVRCTKNRKKMYCSIPNSETSLSQNSTHTMMTV